MLNRRTFALSIISSPVVFRLAGPSILVPSAERRYVSRSGDSGPIDVEVLLAPSERRARAWRNREAREPFDGVVGEFYISSSSPIDLPEGVPGTATTYETIVGAAGQEGSVHVGGFRRGLFVWSVRVHGGPMDPLIAAGEEIATMPLLEEIEVRLAPGTIGALLPGPEVFGGDFEVDEE